MVALASAGHAAPAMAAPSPPLEPAGSSRTVAILAVMVFLTPALGVPYEEMLQDTLKSMLVSFAALAAGLLFFLHQRQPTNALRWHGVMWLPLGLMAYALGSMVWSHTYLGGVEATRWFVFSLLLWLGLNTLSRERAPQLIAAIHWGAVVASSWTALQFWFDWRFFPQGPNPASTFVNRNFFAEFVVCTLPFSALLLAQARSTPRVALLALTLGLNIVALMMTGTRGALSALWLLLVPLLTLLLALPLLAVLGRKRSPLSNWNSSRRWLAGGVLLATVFGLGLTSTGNPKIVADSGGAAVTAFDRAFKRTASISVDDTSLNVRFVMWRATARIIWAHPVTGIGAGAWEAVVPLYQNDGTQIETDYYAHNEPLQLLAEYGVTGLAFLLALWIYLLYAAWATWRNRSAQALSEAPLRCAVLASLLALMWVSNIGFPWRLATTGSLFALSLALLAASDARLSNPGPLRAVLVSFKPMHARGMAAVMVVCLALAGTISQQAMAVEKKLVTAVKIALAISASGDANHPQWDPFKNNLLTLTREGVAINPHYRKITPMVADELGRWGDWQNAVWVWESVVASRPHVVVILANIARGHAQLGNHAKAMQYLARCEALQPRSAYVRSLKLVLLSRQGREAEALKLAKQSLQEGIYDADLLNTTHLLGTQGRDAELAAQSLALRQQHFPDAK
ncbi:MAG: O-antigen ligase domain-containing protein [Polaromonas sp.]|nr:MAG: O-antigen ligase domain-containing protein [Polaromonas sp.]